MLLLSLLFSFIIALSDVYNVSFIKKYGVMYSYLFSNFPKKFEWKS